MNEKVSFFDLQFTLFAEKIIWFRQVIDILAVMGNIGGFSAAIFDILLILFSAYSAANFKLEFVQQAFVRRKNDVDFNPEVFKQGYTFDDKMIQTLQEYT